ncbi:hypothetical protein AMTRI_Chr04g189730 [Amborella trichopoda]
MTMAKALLFFCLFLFSVSSFTLSNGARAAIQSPRKYAKIYELKKGDMQVRVTNWGAIILSVVIPDSKGKLDDVVLGFEKLGSYINDTTYFGAIVGRVANRIKDGRFVLNGQAYRLFRNDGNNTLHGGHRGFSKVFWTMKEKQDGEFPYITLTYHSFDGEQGFPGDLDVSVTYKLVGDLQISVSMEAIPRNKPTPVNLAQHTYWNLAGQNSGPILGNTVQLWASQYTPVDKTLIPTGEILSVGNTPYDFLQPYTVGSRISEVAGGYDINYVLSSSKESNGLRKAAKVTDHKTGRVLELWTDNVGLQFYTGNMLNDVTGGKGGCVYGIHDALALETQGFPDSVNHPNFPSQIVNPGQVYRHNMLYKFSFV